MRANGDRGNWGLNGGGRDCTLMALDGVVCLWRWSSVTTPFFQGFRVVGLIVVVVRHSV